MHYFKNVKSESTEILDKVFVYFICFTYHKMMLFESLKYKIRKWLLVTEGHTNKEF